MSTNAARCGGSGYHIYEDTAGVHEANCPGCEDCRPNDVRKPPGIDYAEVTFPATPPSPVEALAQRLANPREPFIASKFSIEAAAMLRALDRECDRLREALAECYRIADRDRPNGMAQAHALGHITGLSFAALATDAREVDRG